MRRDLERRRHLGMRPHRNASISPIRNPVVVAGRMIVRVGAWLAATSRRTSFAGRNVRGRFKALSDISTPRKGLFKTYSQFAAVIMTSPKKQRKWVVVSYAKPC